MNILTLSTPKLLFIIIVPTVVVIVLFLLLFFPLRKVYTKKNYRNIYYKNVYKIVTINDFYLINNFMFNVGDGTIGKISHLLISDKYFYVITSLYYDGDITGRENDASLIFVPKSGPTKNRQKRYTDNPIVILNKLIKCLSLLTSIEESMFIGVALVNDKCNADIISEKNSDGTDINDEQRKTFIVQNNKLAGFIKGIEKRDVAPLNATQLEKVVRALDKLNRRKR